MRTEGALFQITEAEVLKLFGLRTYKFEDLKELLFMWVIFTCVYHIRN